MVLKPVKSNDALGAAEPINSSQRFVNITFVKNEELHDFVKISEEVERLYQERKFQRQHSRSIFKNGIATMTREEIFESKNIDDDLFVNAFEDETAYATEYIHTGLTKSIENLMQYFDEDVKLEDESMDEDFCIKQLTKGKVESIKTSFHTEINRIEPGANKKEPLPWERQKNGIYEYSIKTDNDLPPNTRNTKMMNELVSNNVNNSLNKSFSPEPQTLERIPLSKDSVGPPIFTSTPKSMPRNLEANYTNLSNKLTGLNETYIQDNSPLSKRKQFYVKSNSTCLIDENDFCQLSVKEKAALYNNFIVNTSKENATLKRTFTSNIKKGEVVIEKQASVKHLTECWEAKLTRSEFKTYPKMYIK